MCDGITVAILGGGTRECSRLPFGTIAVFKRDLAPQLPVEQLGNINYGSAEDGNRNLIMIPVFR